MKYVLKALLCKVPSVVIKFTNCLFGLPAINLFRSRSPFVWCFPWQPNDVIRNQRFPPNCEDCITRVRPGEQNHYFFQYSFVQQSHGSLGHDVFRRWSSQYLLSQVLTSYNVSCTWSNTPEHGLRLELEVRLRISFDVKWWWFTSASIQIILVRSWTSSNEMYNNYFQNTENDRGSVFLLKFFKPPYPSGSIN